jgi:hypothetical protein
MMLNNDGKQRLGRGRETRSFDWAAKTRAYCTRSPDKSPEARSVRVGVITKQHIQTCLKDHASVSEVEKVKELKA